MIEPGQGPIIKTVYNGTLIGVGPEESNSMMEHPCSVYRRKTGLATKMAFGVQMDCLTAGSSLSKAEVRSQNFFQQIDSADTGMDRSRRG
jgi:hypothetical protein